MLGAEKQNKMKGFQITTAKEKHVKKKKHVKIGLDVAVTMPSFSLLFATGESQSKHEARNGISLPTYSFCGCK